MRIEAENMLSGGKLLKSAEYLCDAKPNNLKRQWLPKE